MSSTHPLEPSPSRVVTVLHTGEVIDLATSSTDDLAAYLEPPLTTVSQGIVDIGHAAVALLLDVIRTGTLHADGGHPAPAPTGTVRLPATLRVRSSTGPPPAGA